ncbi:DUF1707 SHOCT-like domain-containing protein, partial [Spinactinospora alkalitolerans]
MTEEPRKAVRASDADREAVARQLAAAAGEGRISTGELRTRLAQVYESHTYGDLERLVEDLPEIGLSRARTVPEHTIPETLHLTAALHDVHRRGRWAVPPRIRASAGRGSVHLDFTEAVIEHDEVVVDARPNWRNVEIIVPEGYRVSTEEAVPGAGDVHDLTSAEPRRDAPRIHIVSRPGLGEIVVRHPRPGRRWSVRTLAARRRAR